MEVAELAQMIAWGLRWALLPVAAFCLYFTVAAETRFPHWPVRMCDFPRAQIAGLSLVTAVLYGLAAWGSGFNWWDWLVPIILLGCVLRQASWIWPYIGPAKNDLQNATVPLTDPSALRIVISNVLQQNEQYDLWREVIEAAQPDVLACAETNERWIKEIGKSFDESHPYGKRLAQDNMYGMSIWSRLPLEDLEVERIVQDDVPSIHAVLVLKSGQRVRLHVMHPRPPAPQERDSSAPRDAELIVMARRIKESRDDGGRDEDLPTIVCGDLNDVAWSRTTRLFLKISGMLDPRRGRGLLNSFHAEHWWFRVPLDHVFVSREFRLIDLKRLAYTGSDHYPVQIDVALEPEKEADQPPHEPDEDDLEDAAEVVQEEAEREDNGEENGNVAKNPEAVEAREPS